MQSPDVGLELSSVFAQIQETSRGLPPPKLVIVDQQSLAQEAYTKDGLQKNVHIVVKNTPFVVTVGLTGSIFGGRIVDFSSLTIETHLLYDAEGNREVPFMKQRPVEYKGKVNDKADQMTLDIKISVLSSHCENMCFRLRFQAIDARSGQPFHALSVLSDPIKVISKPDQITKKGTAPPARKRKRTANDSIMESLARIEEQQKEHAKLLATIREEAQSDRQQQQQCSSSLSSNQFSSLELPSNLFGNLTDLGVVEVLNVPTQLPTIASTSTSLLPLASTSSSSSSSSSLSTSTSTAINSTALETAYNALIEAYSRLPPSDRPEKIRKIIRASSAKKTAVFTEMIAMFSAQGLDCSVDVGVRGGGSVVTGGSSCHGGDSSSLTNGGANGEGCTCPHQLRLAEIDNFYNELLNI